MKQTLNINLGQSLVMTPQQKQEIRLLQLSTIDLQLEIQQAIESNPMLELAEDDADADADADALDESHELDADTDEAESEHALQSDELEADGDWQDEIPEELPVDSSWDDIYPPSLPPAAAGSGTGPGSDDYDSEERNGTEESLADHLAWQLNLTPMSDTDRVIGTAIIEAVNTDGMLTQNVDDLLQGFDTELHI